MRTLLGALLKLLPIAAEKAGKWAVRALENKRRRDQSEALEKAYRDSRNKRNVERTRNPD